MNRDHIYKKAKEAVKPVRFRLSIYQSVDQAIEQLRAASKSEEQALYFYVLDEKEKLLGTVGAKQLLTSPPDKPIACLINTKIKVIQEYQTVRDALLLMQKYRLLAIPVVEKGKLLGVIDIQNYFDDALELESSRQQYKIFQTLGYELDEEEGLSPLKKYQIRFPWMICNMLGGILCAIISMIYSMVLVKALVLAMFIPLVLSLSESISMQSMSQSLHKIHGGRFNGFKSKLHHVYEESKLFILIAFTCGTSIGLIALLWRDGVLPAVTIGVSIILGVLVSATIGSISPLILQALNLDPKIASGPFVLMLVDVLTTLIYLTIGFWWLV